MNIQHREILDIADVAKLDELAEIVAEGENAKGWGYSDRRWEKERLGKNAAARYRRLIKRLTGDTYQTHFYTGSGCGIVPGCIEVYFGE